jgi:hypothetical protein
MGNISSLILFAHSLTEFPGWEIFRQQISWSFEVILKGFWVPTTSFRQYSTDSRWLAGNKGLYAHAKCFVIWFLAWHGYKYPLVLKVLLTIMRLILQPYVISNSHILRILDSLILNFRIENTSTTKVRAKPRRLSQTLCIKEQGKTQEFLISISSWINRYAERIKIGQKCCTVIGEGAGLALENSRHEPIESEGFEACYLSIVARRLFLN